MSGIQTQTHRTKHPIDPVVSALPLGGDKMRAWLIIVQSSQAEICPEWDEHGGPGRHHPVHPHRHTGDHGWHCHHRWDPNSHPCCHVFFHPFWHGSRDIVILGESKFILTIILYTMDDIVSLDENHSHPCTMYCKDFLYPFCFLQEHKWHCHRRWELIHPPFRPGHLDDLAVIATNVFIFTIILNTMVDIFSMSFLFIISSLSRNHLVIISTSYCHHIVIISSSSLNHLVTILS